MFNQLLRSIILVGSAAMPIWAAVRLLLGYRAKERGVRIDWPRELLLTAFFGYLVMIGAMTIAPTASSINGEAGYNLVPIVNLIDDIRLLGGPPEAVKYELENFFGNLFLLFPLGIFLPVLWPRFRCVWNVLYAGFAVAAFIEITQYISQFAGSYRVADIDDVILNTLGACLGFYVFIPSSRFSVPAGRRSKLKLEL